MEKTIFELYQEPSMVMGWPVDAFKKAHRPDDNDLNGFALSLLNKDESEINPDNIAFIYLRTFIRNGNMAKSDQKYIIGIRFYSFGDIATIDVISLEKDFHRDIIYAHMKSMGWPSYKEGTGMKIDPLDESHNGPFMVVGGHLNIDHTGAINFLGSSGDYGSDILFSDSNSIAEYVATACGLKVFPNGDSLKKGEDFIQKISEIMLRHKLKKNFYEKLVEETFEASSRKRVFTTQHLGSLMTMKIEDRIIDENPQDPMLIMVNELTDGFMRSVMLYGFAKKIRNAKEEEL